MSEATFYKPLRLLDDPCSVREIVPQPLEFDHKLRIAPASVVENENLTSRVQFLL
jgi:hypothetical protein